MPRIPCGCRAGWLIRRFKASPALQVLAFDPRHNSPLVVSGSRGQGRFIYSAIPLEPQEGMVFQYLPFLAQAIVDELHVAPTLAADNLCVYVDVGGEPKVDPAVVVAQLKSWSVREVHLGAFYGSESFGSLFRASSPPPIRKESRCTPGWNIPWSARSSGTSTRNGAK